MAAAEIPPETNTGEAGARRRPPLRAVLFRTSITPPGEAVARYTGMFRGGAQEPGRRERRRRGLDAQHRQT